MMATKPRLRKRKVNKLTSPSISNGQKAANDPIIMAAKAFLRPFDAEKGVAASLADGRPSQKFMAKSQAQITLTSGQIMAFMVSPNAASDAVEASVVIAIGAATGGVFTTDGNWANATVGDLVGPFGTIQRVSTSTPYTLATLATGFEYCCVGSAVKFTYEGSELYRGGTFRYLYDKESMYNAVSSWAGDSVNGLITYVNSAANTVRQSVNKDNVVEINTTSTVLTYAQGETSGAGWGPTGGTTTNPIGGTTATTRFPLYPSVLGYYVNTSGNTISFHMDVVEHWSLSSPTIQALQTPSYAHAPLATHINAVMDNVRQAHAGRPNIHHATVAADTLKVMKSPMGHELLNVGLRAALA